MKYFLALLAFSVFFMSSCDRVKQKTKSAINKSGETVGKGTSEFVKGVSEGVDQSFQCTVNLSGKVLERGLGYGKFIIAKGADATSDNVLTMYIIFNKDFRDTLSARVFDAQGREYGRTKMPVEGKSGETKYYDFVFDPRTDIESKSTFKIE